MDDCFATGFLVGSAVTVAVFLLVLLRVVLAALRKIENELG